METTRKIALAALLAAGITAAAAMAGGASDDAAAIAAAGSADEAAVVQIDAEELWRENCAGCHGRDGRGQTRVGRRAGVKDLTDHEYQQSFSDEQAFRHTKEGMYDEDGEELMKPFGKGLSEDNGLTDAELEALVRFVRTFDPEREGAR